MLELNNRAALHVLVDELSDQDASTARFFLELLKHGRYQHRPNVQPSTEKHYLHSEPTPPPLQHQDAFGAHVDASTDV